MRIERWAPIVAFAVVLVVLVGVRIRSDGSDAVDVGPESRATGQADAARPAAAGDLQFTDVTARAGLEEPHSDRASTGEPGMTAGAAVADVDGDGDLDVYLTRVGLPNRLLLNDGDGRFTDRTDASGVGGTDTAQGSSAAGFADVDGDGDVDLVVTAAGSNSTALYSNDGDGTFTDVTSGSGLDELPPAPAGTSAHLHGVTFADYDRDGHLDLMLTHWDDTVVSGLNDPAAEGIRGRSVCERNEWLAERGYPRSAAAPPNRSRLYRNEGGGRFRDVTAVVGLPLDEVLAFTSTFADIDGDGWDDLLITGDFCTSRLFRNVDGTSFVDVTGAAGVATDENGMGSVVTDLNGDGLPDWFVTSIGPVGGDATPLQLGGGFGSSGNRAYLNNGDGTFSDVTDELGLRNGGWGWGAAVEDFGNDGRRSVVMTNGYSVGPDDTGPPASDPLVFWVRDGATHIEVADAIGLDDDGLGRALVPFDMERDGDLDLLVANFGSPPRLYRNDTPALRWLTVQLDDPSSAGNRSGIGATVVVTPTDGTPVTSWVSGGGSYESQVPPEVHVGLDRAEHATVAVTWPGDDRPQVLEGVDADQVLVVRRSG